MSPVMVADGTIPLRRAPTGVADLLQSIRDVMQPQARALDVTLRLEIARDLPPAVLIDRRKIAWALTAVVGNALRYVRHGTSRMPGGSVVVAARTDTDTNQVILEVQDDGPGISADTIRATAAGIDEPRAGLALSMVRDVVGAHGGRLDIESRMDAAGHGTTVRFRLPVV
jgi:signal transduction histidine kinase